MRRYFWSLLATLPVVAIAQNDTEYRCTLSGAVRRVEVVHLAPAPVPCEVRYHKDTEQPGAAEVLWSARNEVGYCEARANEFVARLESLGWDCRNVADLPAATRD